MTGCTVDGSCAASMIESSQGGALGGCFDLRTSRTVSFSPFDEGTMSFRWRIEPLLNLEGQLWYYLWTLLAQKYVLICHLSKRLIPRQNLLHMSGRGDLVHTRMQCLTFLRGCQKCSFSSVPP
jgi:hypothetical protein